MNQNKNDKRCRKQKFPKHSIKRAKFICDEDSDEENFFNLAADKQQITFTGLKVIKGTLNLSDESDDDNDGDGWEKASGEDTSRWKRNAVDLSDDETDGETDEDQIESDEEVGIASQKEQNDSVNRSPSPLPSISPACLARVRKELGSTQSTSDLDRALSDLRKVARGGSSSPSPATPRNASICIDLDDSLTFASPADRDIIVKVRTRHGVMRFPMKAADHFKNIIRQLADMENVSEDNIYLTLREKNIVSFDTPLAVKLNVADIIECVVMESNGTYTSNEEDKLIEIKVQGNDNASKKIFRVSKDAPLKLLMKEYCQLRNLSPLKIRFSFDGDVIDGNECPADLDMENGDMIDVITKKQY